jgi:hypothetical protein
VDYSIFPGLVGPLRTDFQAAVLDQLRRAPLDPPAQVALLEWASWISNKANFDAWQESAVNNR